MPMESAAPIVTIEATIESIAVILPTIFDIASPSCPALPARLQ
jgi:hypothetical protein